MAERLWSGAHAIRWSLNKTNNCFNFKCGKCEKFNEGAKMHVSTIDAGNNKVLVLGLCGKCRESNALYKSGHYIVTPAPF